MAKQLTKAQQDKVLALIEDFELDGSTDYDRMTKDLTKLGLHPANKFVWACLNKAKEAAEEYDISFL